MDKCYKAWVCNVNTENISQLNTIALLHMFRFDPVCAFTTNTRPSKPMCIISSRDKLRNGIYRPYDMLQHFINQRVNV